MTDLARAVEDAVTSEWRTTREIAEAAGMRSQEGICRARFFLRRMVRQGRAERSEATVGTSQGERTAATWRLRP